MEYATLHRPSLPPRESLDLIPVEASPRSPSKAWTGLLRLLSCLRPAPRAVHSLEETSPSFVSSKKRLSQEEEQGSSAPPPPPGTATSFAALPDHLLLGILSHLRGANRATHFNVCGVSRAWRQIGRQLFFASPWSEPHLICHPAQLFCLSPRPVETNRAGLLKCFVRREGGRAPGACCGRRRFSLFLGRDHRHSRRTRFLMCAVQASRNELRVHLDKEGQSRPAGRLTANGLSTCYTLSMAPGVRLAVPESGAGSAAAGAPLPLPLLAAAASGSRVGGSGSRRRGGSSGIGAVAAQQQQQLQLPWAEVGAWGGPGGRGGASWLGAGAEGCCAGGKEAPPVHGTLRYRARLRGFMQPRRVEVDLPPPRQLFFGHTLPTLCCEPSTGTAGRACWSGGCAGAGSGSARRSSSSSSRPKQQGQQGQGEASETQGQGAAQQARQAQQASAQEERGQQPLELRNKPPQWNNDLRCWVLNFRGRVKLASVKNFQLIRSGDPMQRVVLQFGKVERDVYILDFDPTVLTAFQAFCVALSTFDSKMLL